jgi:hypothetical protein
MLTLTAPGEREHKRFSPGGWRADRPDCPCRVEHLGEWNASHSKRWNHLRTLLRREYPDLEFMRGVEVQRRGALHDHVILWSASPIDIVAIQGLALRAGFGCSCDWAPAEPGSRKLAYYISKYVTKACDARDLVPWLAVDLATGEILSDRATYRTWSMSRDWGLTMAQVRAVCAEFAARAAAARLDGTLAVLRDVLGAEPLALAGSPPT